MGYSSGLSDYHVAERPADDAPADHSAATGDSRFKKVAALAYARWEALRSDASLPSISHGHREESRLFTPNCVQVVWDKEVSVPTISYLGGDLAGQFASLSGEAWPNLPIESPLVVLLHDISQFAIDEGEATEFDEQVEDSQGRIRDIQGLALPFAGEEPGTFLVDLIFDLDNPIPVIAKSVQQSGKAPDPDDILLLEQELDPDEMPRHAMAPARPPVLFVCVSGDERRLPPVSVPPPLKSAAWPAAPALPATRTPGELSRRDPVLAHWVKAVRDTAEPLLLTEPLEIAPEAADASVGAPMAAPSDHLLLSLEVARNQAAAASGSEERSHTALYKAISAAYDFALFAAEAPERLERIVLEAGLTMQARAPMTPVVKLIFGADYDRTRLAEYASALSHAFRLGLPAGSFADYLLTFDGGLKGIVRVERQLHSKPEPAKKSGLAKLETKLRNAPVRAFGDFQPEGREFSLVLARRMPDGSMAVLGEVPPDERLFSAAARRFLKR